MLGIAVFLERDSLWEGCDPLEYELALTSHLEHEFPGAEVEVSLGLRRGIQVWDTEDIVPDINEDDVLYSISTLDADICANPNDYPGVWGVG